MAWSKKKCGLYLNDHLADFEADFTARLSPPAQFEQHKRVCYRLMGTHLIGFGSGGAVGVSADATSYIFDGTGDFKSAPDSSDWDLFTDTSNMTIDLFVKFAVHTGTEYIMNQGNGTLAWNFQHVHGSGFKMAVIDSTEVIDMPLGGEITDTNWHHLAFIKVVDEYGIYVDDTQVSFLDDPSTISSITTQLNIGCWNASSNFFNGNKDEIRIYHGNPFGAAPNVGLSDTITAPTEQHTVDGSTKLLIHGAEPVVSGSKGTDGWTALDATGNHTTTGHGDLDEDTVDFQF
ncbi:MAG: hypothetical protein HOG49_18250 [Candidatus Scalindua sp.]|jgi:hypothetical protein|nr:hypothetical protein [Candidatus Scalindua sp.]